METSYLLWAIGLAFLVTWVPRVFPFILVKYSSLPKIVERLLKYLPITIIFALTLSSLVSKEKGTMFPTFLWLEIVASIPTFWIAYRYKNLLWTVVVGIVIIAVLRIVV
ncbi:AzlD domain-containing protein [Streptococcus gallolyticus]|nr:AzlD domain-containing protein [Streptococcus gallolyticus]MBY5040874.1 AzlD domain-containing protein [Streptococcus gallolyticus]